MSDKRDLRRKQAHFQIASEPLRLAMEIGANRVNAMSDWDILVSATQRNAMTIQELSMRRIDTLRSQRRSSR
jgi:hypothetical protein